MSTMGFVSIGFYVGPTAYVTVSNEEGTGSEPILSIYDEERWVSISSGVGCEGTKAHLDFARELVAGAGKYLVAVEKLAADKAKGGE